MPADQLDSWAEIFFEGRCSGLIHVSLSVFLTDPLEHIGGIDPGVSAETAPVFGSDDYLPLLPKQAEAAKRIQEKWARDDARALAIMGNHLTVVPRI